MATPPKGQGEPPAPLPADELGQPELTTGRPPTVKKFNLAQAREETRAALAGGLAILLGLLALLLVILTATGSLELGEAKDLAEVILAPIVVLTGTALGFYFGSQDREDGR